MKIIIVGNGKVGYAIASQLAGERHDIVMVDDSAAALHKAENEDVVADFLESHGNFALEPFTVGEYRSDTGMLTLFPHIHHTDGFFIARLRRDARMR